MAPFDHLFQLNVVLWLALPQPEGSTDGFFYRCGFTLAAVGTKFRIPDEICERLREHGITDKRQLVVDVVLRNSVKKTYLLLECKSGPPPVVCARAPGGLDETEQQACRYLVLPVQCLQDAGLLKKGKQKATCHVAYFVRETTARNWLALLETLSKTLEAVPLTCNPFGALGLDCIEGRFLLFLHGNTALGSGHQQVCFSSSGPYAASYAEPDVLYPLYILPIDPLDNAKDEYGRRAFHDRVQSHFRAEIVLKMTTRPFQISVLNILEKAIPIWHQLDSSIQHFYRSKAKELVGGEIAGIVRAGLLVPSNAAVDSYTFAFEGVDPATQARIKKHLSRPKRDDTAVSSAAARVEQQLDLDL